jgi:membrane-associated protease RseP (regulator of RpoE activity)
MLRRTLTAALPALALIVATPGALFGSGPGTPDRVVVVGDEDNDVDLLDVDEPGDPGDVVVHVDRRHSGFLGVRLVGITPELREHFGAPKDAGVLVGGVEKDSPAEKAGIKVGDVVTSADGERIGSARDLSRAVRHRKSGETMKLDLTRDKAAKQLSVTVAERPEREVHVGDLGPMIEKRMKIYRDRDFDAPMVIGPMHDMGRVQERLDEIEKRLKDLEKKLPSSR